MRSEPQPVVRNRWQRFWLLFSGVALWLRRQTQRTRESRSRSRGGPYSGCVTNKTSKDGTPKSYRERIDPGDEFGKQVKGLALLGSSPFGRVLQALGVEKETLDDAKALRRTYERLVSEPDRVADALAPLGWAFHEMAPFDDYVAAATLVGQGRRRKPRTC